MSVYENSKFDILRNFVDAKNKTKQYTQSQYMLILSWILFPISKTNLQHWVAMSNIWPDIEHNSIRYRQKHSISALILWAKSSNLNIGPDIEVFLFDIEYKYSISTFFHADIE